MIRGNPWYLAPWMIDYILDITTNCVQWTWFVFCMSLQFNTHCRQPPCLSPFLLRWQFCRLKPIISKANISLFYYTTQSVDQKLHEAFVLFRVVIQPDSRMSLLSPLHFGLRLCYPFSWPFSKKDWRKGLR